MGKEVKKYVLYQKLTVYSVHDAVTGSLVIDPDSILPELKREDFPWYKGEREKEIREFIKEHRGKSFWEVLEDYAAYDVKITDEVARALERQLLSLGYSMTDRRYPGIAKIINDVGKRGLRKGMLKVFSKEEFKEWSMCYLGGMTMLLDRNLEQRVVRIYDYNSMYTAARIGKEFPVGDPKVIKRPDNSVLSWAFGLIKAVVKDSNKTPYGVPCIVDSEPSLISGDNVYYKGTTEELKKLIS